MYLEITVQMSAYKNPSCELNFIYISVSIQTFLFQPDSFPYEIKKPNTKFAINAYVLFT